MSLQGEIVPFAGGSLEVQLRSALGAPDQFDALVRIDGAPVAQSVVVGSDPVALHAQEITPGSLVVVSSPGFDDETGPDFARRIAEVVGHEEFRLIVLPPGESLTTYAWDGEEAGEIVRTWMGAHFAEVKAAIAGALEGVHVNLGYPCWECGNEGKLPAERAEQLATLAQAALGRLLPDAPWHDEIHAALAAALEEIPDE